MQVLFLMCERPCTIDLKYTTLKADIANKSSPSDESI